MSATALIERPKCPLGHGPMTLRQNPTKDAAWMGAWYDCQATEGSPGECTSSTLLESPALRQFHARLGAKR